MKKITLIALMSVVFFTIKAQFPNYGTGVYYDDDYSFTWEINFSETNADSCYILVKEGALLLDSIPYSEHFAIEYTGRLYTGVEVPRETMGGSVAGDIYGFNVRYSPTDTFKYRGTSNPTLSPHGQFRQSSYYPAYTIAYWYEKFIDFHLPGW